MANGHSLVHGEGSEGWGIEIDKEGSMYVLDSVITMKKSHPCGGNTWKIVRVGADIKLQCETCGKYVNLTRDELKKRAKAVK